MAQTHTHKRPEFSPADDNAIYRRFTVRTMDSKMQNKLALQEELGWAMEKRMPLLCLPAGMTDAIGGELFGDVIDGILELQCQLVVRGIGSEKYGKLFTRIENESSHRVKILSDTDVMRRKMYASADIALFFNGESAEIENCLRYATVPVSLSQESLKDYNPIQESGNAFLAEEDNPWQWFAALVRALETYKLPYDWRTIQKHAMKSVGE